MSSADFLPSMLSLNGTSVNLVSTWPPTSGFQPPTSELNENAEYSEWPG